MQLGNLNLLILKSISKSEKYGLEIIDDIAQETNNQVVVKQPSLYSGLRRLEQRGLITSRWEDSDIGGRRHYYSITNLGRTELASHSNSEFVVENTTPEKNVEAKEEIKQEEVVTPNEIPTENVFTANEEVKAEDEKTVSQLEQSVFNDEEPAGYEQQTLFSQVDQPAEEEKAEFSEYQPEQDADDTNRKTFSDKMRDYVEPENNYDEYKMQETVKQEEVVEETPVKEENNAESDIIENAQKIANNYNEPQDTVVEYVSAKESANDEINYKDLLGDLDADLNNTETAEQPAEEQTVNVENICCKAI